MMQIRPCEHPNVACRLYEGALYLSLTLSYDDPEDLRFWQRWEVLLPKLNANRER